MRSVSPGILPPSLSTLVDIDIADVAFLRTARNQSWMVGRPSLIHRPLPGFYLAAVEKDLHSCKIKSGQRPGYEAREGLDTRPHE